MFSSTVFALRVAQFSEATQANFFELGTESAGIFRSGHAESIGGDHGSQVQPFLPMQSEPG